MTDKTEGVPDELFGVKITFKPCKTQGREALKGVVFGMRATGRAFLLEADEKRQRVVVFLPLYDQQAVAEQELKQLRKTLSTNFSGVFEIEGIVPQTIEVDEAMAMEGMRQELARAVLDHFPDDLVQALYHHAAGAMSRAKEKVQA